MSILFPTSLDALSNPAATDLVENANTLLDHDRQHSDANDAIEALEAKVGVNSSAVTTTHDYKLSGVTGSDKAVSKTGTETLTNKTLTTPTITTPTIADFTSSTHTHQNNAGGGQLNATSVFSAGTVPTARLGSGSASSASFLRGDQTWDFPSLVITVNTYTSSGTWTKPAGLKYATVEVQGPGGGGGQGTTVNNGGGGGSGGYARKYYAAASLSATEAYVVGTGGAGHINSAGSGSDGSAASTFKSISGGAGTGGGQTSGGVGGTASGGDINVTGQQGSSNGTATLVNFGANSILGLGGVGTQQDGTGYGSGGSPGNANAANGGSGKGGVIIVTEYSLS